MIFQCCESFFFSLSLSTCRRTCDPRELVKNPRQLSSSQWHRSHIMKTHLIHNYEHFAVVIVVRPRHTHYVLWLFLASILRCCATVLVVQASSAHVWNCWNNNDGRDFSFAGGEVSGARCGCSCFLFAFLTRLSYSLFWHVVPPSTHTESMLSQIKSISCSFRRQNDIKLMVIDITHKHPDAHVWNVYRRIMPIC